MKKEEKITEEGKEKDKRGKKETAKRRKSKEMPQKEKYLSTNDPAITREHIKLHKKSIVLQDLFSERNNPLIRI